MIQRRAKVTGTAIAIISLFLFPPFPARGLALKQATSSPGMRALKQTVRVDQSRAAHLKKVLHRPTLFLGSRGADVVVLQKFLAKYGMYKNGDHDGVFGSRTQQAVRVFQSKESLAPVGVVGPKTWAHILDISNKKIIKQIAPSSAPVFVRVSFTNAVGENGSPKEPQSAFASTTPTMYAVVELKNASQETAVGYIRYYRGSYIDSRVSHPSRNGLKYLHFQWTLKEGAERPTGVYTFSFYLNGGKATTTSITIF